MTGQTAGRGAREEPRRPPPPHGPIRAGEPLGPWSHRPADEAEARALASGLRVQILRLTLRESLTNKEIAERLERNPATVLHHVRTLLGTGFLMADDERRGARGAREVPYRATGKSWYVTREMGDRGLLDAFLAELDRAGLRDARMTRLGLRLSREHRDQLEQRLGELLTEYADLPPDEDGDDWSVFLVLHPDRSTPRDPPTSGDHAEVPEPGSSA